jgi:hypothetical protein
MYLPTKSFKLLGVLFDEYLSFDAHITNLQNLSEDDRKSQMIKCLIILIQHGPHTRLTLLPLTRHMHCTAAFSDLTYP